METGVGRRAFVGSVVSGLPLLAAGAMPAFGQGSTPGVGGGAGAGVGAGVGADGVNGRLRDGTPDAMFSHALKEIGKVHARARRHQRVSGEDARVVAAQLQGMVVYMKQLDMDRPSKKALRQLIAKQGREGVLAQSFDLKAGRRALKQYGLEEDAPWRAVPDADYAARRQALDQLLAGGPTSVLSQAAAALEQLGNQADAQGLQTAGLRRVAQTWQDGYCQQLAAEIARLGVSAGILEGFSWFFRPAKAVELMVLAAMAIQNGFYWYNCRP